MATYIDLTEDSPQGVCPPDLSHRRSLFYDPIQDSPAFRPGVSDNSSGIFDLDSLFSWHNNMAERQQRTSFLIEQLAATSRERRRPSSTSSEQSTKRRRVSEQPLKREPRIRTSSTRLHTPRATSPEDHEKEEVEEQTKEPGEDEESRWGNCIICMDTMTEITATHCGHLFCHSCLQEALIAGENAGPRNNGSKCPMCRKPVSRKKAGDFTPLLFMTKSSRKASEAT